MSNNIEVVAILERLFGFILGNVENGDCDAALKRLQVAVEAICKLRDE